MSAATDELLGAVLQVDMARAALGQALAELDAAKTEENWRTVRLLDVLLAKAVARLEQKRIEAHEKWESRHGR